MKQRLIFSVLMTFFMTFGMELYNNLLQHPTTDYSIFITICKEVCFMGIVVFILSTWIGNPFAARFVGRHCDIKKDPAYFCRLLRQGATIVIMCPMMSLTATIVFQCIPGNIGWSELPYQWLETLIRNFPMAFFWNIFGAAPLTHWITSKMFSLSRT